MTLTAEQLNLKVGTVCEYAPNDTAPVMALVFVLNSYFDHVWKGKRDELQLPVPEDKCAMALREDSLLSDAINDAIKNSQYEQLFEHSESLSICCSSCHLCPHKIVL